jgi:hypothetical protein
LCRLSSEEEGPEVSARAKEGGGKDEPRPYDPLDYENLARSVVDALMGQELQSLPPAAFSGAGVYAIYYLGAFPAYRPISSSEARVPIYVGKAVPSGQRKGGGEDTGGKKLYERLKQHTRSITSAENLSLEDFRCRYLVVEAVWIGLAERFLVEHYRPVWNVVVDGFGNHAVGQYRETGARPLWDVLHPCRPWARRLPAKRTFSDVEVLIAEHFRELAGS